MNDLVDQSKTYKFGDSFITQQDVIYETDFFFAMFDKYPVTPGHTLIISKRKFLNLIDIQSNEWMDLYTLIKVILGRIKTYDLEKFYINKINYNQDNTSRKFMLDAINCLRFDKEIQGFNIGMNDGQSSGRKVYHFHLHIIPRFKNDLKKYGGGIRMVVPTKSDFFTAQ